MVLRGLKEDASGTEPRGWGRSVPRGYAVTERNGVLSHVLWLGHHTCSNLLAFTDTFLFLERSVVSSLTHPNPPSFAKTRSIVCFAMKPSPATGTRSLSLSSLSSPVQTIMLNITFFFFWQWSCFSTRKKTPREGSPVLVLGKSETESREQTL